MVIASELREGMALRIEGQIYKVLEAESKAGARGWEEWSRLS